MKKARSRLVEKEKDEAIAGKGLGARKKNGFRGIERSRATLSGGKCSPGSNLVKGLSIHL